MYAPRRERAPEPDERLGRWILGGIVLIAIGAGAWYWQTHRAADTATDAAPGKTITADEPRILHPIETAGDVAGSAPAAEQIAALIGAARFESMFIPDDLVAHIVATVDNLPRTKIAMRLNPAKPPGGEFVAMGGEDRAVLGAANFARYSAWVELIESLDPDATVALYRRLYPQFQAAYENLGNPKGYFNDRVIEVIDHLLTMPVPPENVVLARPNVMYEFADPRLEAESAGRKLLIRMGPGNAARVSMKLRDIRDRIAAQKR
jgi:hypothetical protein